MILNILNFALINFIIILFFSRYLNKLGICLITVFNFIIGLFSILCYFVDIVVCDGVVKLYIYKWLNIINFDFNIIIILDSLSLLMLLVVVFVSFLVHIYSFGYMSNDPFLKRFISYLSLFTFFMILLVTSDNLIQLFIGWEGVGIVSFLLINFWFTRNLANRSALKAVILNKIGDCGLLFGIVLCWIFLYNINFVEICLLVQNFDFYIEIFNLKINFVWLIGMCFFLGVIGKSAQLFLHVWLPDAMEGPTPVSALLHAATMVTAGVFLLLKLSYIFVVSESLLMFLFFFGVLTAFFAGSVGCFQNDIKKIIAYSTCGQLGFMVMSCGLGNFSLAFFHLFNHAFFKALLFLGAGAVIHGLNDEQDIRKMGGLVSLMPLNYLALLVGSLALCGFPFFTGFFSKDLIMEGSFFNSSWFFLVFFVSLLTLLYSLRLLYFVFYTKPQGSFILYRLIHEDSWYIQFPLVVLIVFSILIGYLFKDVFLGFGSLLGSNLLFNDLVIFRAEFLFTHFDLLRKFYFICFSFMIACLYIYLLNKNFFKFQSFNFLIGFYVFFNKRWFFDHFYNSIVKSIIFDISYYKLFRGLDKGFINWLFVDVIVESCVWFFKFFGCMFSGFIFNYLLYFNLGFLFIFVALILLDNVLSLSFVFFCLYSYWVLFVFFNKI